MTKNFDINAAITFIVKQKEKPVYESSAITGMVPKLYFKVEKKKILIKNARLLTNLNLDKNGFELHEFSSRFNDKNISKNLHSYKEELKLFLKERFNFKKIFIFDTTRRSNSINGAYNEDGRRQPAERAHVDYTNSSGPLRAKKILGDKLYNQAVLNKSRIIQINFWKPLCKKVMSSPLAIADPSTVENDDLIATDQKFPDRVGEIYHLAYNKSQTWYWIPQMKDNEILLIKGWDNSNNNNIVKYTPHTSFNLENQDVKKYPRDSIEARVFMIL